MNALEITGLTKKYDGFKLDNLTLAIPEGSITGYIGENGAGKSTTIKLIIGAIRKDAGTISVLGTEDIASVKEDMGVVMDEVGFPSCFTAVQVGKVMSNAYKRWDDKAYQDLLEKLEIPSKKAFGDLSRGNRMKLGIAVAMSHDPKILLLDEATSGLDPIVRDEVVTMIREFASDGRHTVLMSSHIVSDLEKVCDRLAFLHKGKLLMYKSYEEISEDYPGLGIEDFFLKMVKGELV